MFKMESHTHTHSNTTHTHTTTHNYLFGITKKSAQPNRKHTCKETAQGPRGDSRVAFEQVLTAFDKMIMRHAFILDWCPVPSSNLSFGYRGDDPEMHYLEPSPQVSSSALKYIIHRSVSAPRSCTVPPSHSPPTPPLPAAGLQVSHCMS